MLKKIMKDFIKRMLAKNIIILFENNGINGMI
jgi:hypothetical protein